MQAMRRLLSTATTTVIAFGLMAATAMAHDGGQGTYGAAGDKVVTNAGFILLAFFPTFILMMSLLQWKLDKRKDARKAAAKGRASSKIWSGGW